MKNSIRKIYDSLEEYDETIIFQVKTRKTLNKILDELEQVDDLVGWDVYKKIPVKNIYLFVGKWRLGNAGIFPYHSIDCYDEYRFDDFIVDWKSPISMQYGQKRKLDKVLDIFDKYREDIKMSRKTYDEVAHLERSK